MKNLKNRTGFAVLLALMVTWASCQKEKSAISPVDQLTNSSTERLGGVVADDPAAVSKVPLIVSADYLAKGFASETSAEMFRKVKGISDVTAPSLSIVSPVSGSTVSGTINVTVSASDNIGMKSVSLSIDGGAAVSTSSISPFTNAWNSATVANGTHTLTLTAADAAGNKTTKSVSVTVSNTAPGDITSPVVNLSSPTDQSSVTGTVSVVMSATDNVGVSSVSISIDNVVVSTSTSYSWNTSNFAAGSHIVTATAKDAAGNQGTKSATVTINTTVVQPPSTSGVQITMPPVGNQGGEGACVAFAAGYAARSAEQYYRTGASSYSYATNIFSPEFLYNQIKFGTDCGSGTSTQTALDFIMAKGIPTFQSMPYSSTNGCSLLPTATQSSEALNYKISSYSKIIYTDKAAIKAMVSQNHPVIVNVLADDSFINAKAGFVWKTYSGSGGLPHCIVICGYDDSKNAYKIMNSWGTTWGDAGYSWIDYDFFPTRASYYTYVIN